MEGRAMKLTRAMIWDGRSDRGGWNRAQFEVLGVEYPPKKGWPARIIGTEISGRDYERFLQLKGAHKRKKIGAPKRPPKEHAELFDKLVDLPIDERKRVIDSFCLSTSPEDFANRLYNDSNRDLA